MAESETTTETSSSSPLRRRQQRRVFADVISSPELPRRSSRLKTLVECEEENPSEAPPLRSANTDLVQPQRNPPQSMSGPPLTVRRFECDDQDSAPDRPTVGATMLPTSSSEKGTDSSFSERDSLLERLREKEKQFDEKITTLDETLLCAERGRVQRDHIIDSLRAEVKQLRGQLELATASKSQTDELRKRLLSERTAALEEARAKVEELSDNLHEKGRRVKQLEKELAPRKVVVTACPENRSSSRTVLERSRPSRQQQQQGEAKKSLMRLGANENSLTEREREREREKQKRERYAATLQALQDEVHALEQSYKVTRKEKEALAEENNALRSKLEAIEESMETRAATAMRAMQSSLSQKREIEAEVVATRLSMARLLRLLSEVPEMRQYLRVNEVDGDVIFAGYATSTVTSGPEVLCSDPLQHPQRRRSNAMLTVAPGTGVDDGIYGGNSLLQSCNVYLNGQWCRQLQEIIDDENYFLRRTKIHLGDLEDTTRCGRGGDGVVPRVPAPSDVLQGRQHDKDFWIPYSIFVEAQKFKNRYFPSLSYECFYPFLIAINRVWNDKLRRRVASETQRRLCEQQQRQKKLWGTRKKQMADIVSFSEHPHDVSSSALALWQKLQELRREVRRRVTGRNSLELFHLYDQLTRCALHQLRGVQVEHARLLEQHLDHRCFENTRVGVDLKEEDEEDEEDEGERNNRRVEREEERRGVDNVDLEHLARLRRALSALTTEVQEVSGSAASRIGASCRDLQQFLEALRDQQLGTMRPAQAGTRQQQEHQKLQTGREDSPSLPQAKDSGYVPTCTLLRIIDGVLGFVDEVQQEVFAAQTAVSRCVTRADAQLRPILHPAGANEDSVAEETEEEEEENVLGPYQRTRRRQRGPYLDSLNSSR